MIDTEIAKKLDIEKIYFSFDGSQTLKVAVIKKEGITSPEDAVDKVKLFVITESDSTSKKFSYGELDKILGNTKVAQNEYVRQARDEGELGVKLIEITKKKDNNKKVTEISVKVEDNKLDKDTSTTHEFKEIKKGLWENPESDIAKLTNPDKEEVKKPLKKILEKISDVHSEYKNSLTYAGQAREAAHHGFMAGALANFRYRHNLRVYLEQFAGRGYADIVLVPRGKDRSLNAIPIIIELKAATKTELKEGKIGEKSGTTPAAALKQAEDYTKGFQPNVMRVLTTANDIIYVGVNLDHPSPISGIEVKQRNQEITPLFNEILGSIDERNKGEINEGKLREQIQNNIERIYHTLPGTGEKGDNHYFSRFLLGQSLLLNEALATNFEKHVFIYNENIPTEAHPEPQSQRLKDKKNKGQNVEQPSQLDQSHGIVTMVFIPKNAQKSVCVMNIVETDGRAEVFKKGIPLDKLKRTIKGRKIVELNLNFNINKQKSKFEEYFSIEVSEPVSLEQYSSKKADKFEGDFKDVPYPTKLKEKFDEVFKSQHIQDQSPSGVPDPDKLKKILDKALGEYKELLEKIGEGVSPFKSLIEKEAHFQAVLHGAFDHYSDIGLGESQENRVLVLTEFQTGRGKRVDMLINGVKFADQNSNAKEYIPVGLELKGPREGKEADALKKEASQQIHTEYETGVTYKTLTDGDEVACIGVVFDKKADSANSLIQLSNENEFTPVKVVHSSIMQIDQQPPRKKFNSNSCVGQGSRRKRGINSCLFSKGDVEEFSKGKVDENNVDKIIIDSEKFLTYVKNSQDEEKNAQLVEFVGDKSIEGDRKYLLNKVVEDQGYERYVQNERIKDLHGDISQQASSSIKSSKLKGRLTNAAGGIQLIRGIHGAIVSCQDGVTTDCGLNLGGIGWSFASQPIENVMVKITPKVVASAERIAGKIIPGVLGKQTKFAVRVVGVKFGSTIARGTAGAIAGVFDIVDIGMSASNLVDCKKRENGNNPCGEKEIRDNIATISFSTVSFVSGVALTTLSMPGIGIAVGVGLMVLYGIYSGVSNIVEYKKKYDTTHDENWRIFWHTFAFQPIPLDVQHLAARKEMVNSLTRGSWKMLNGSPDNVVAYAFGLGKVNGNALSSSHAKIFMNKKNIAYTKDLSRVIPDDIAGASMICLPQITSQDYEKGIKNSVLTALYYCDNAIVMSRSNTSQVNPTIVYDLQNVVNGRIIGSNQWNNNFLIYQGDIEITGSNNVVTGGDNVVNRFIFLDTPSFSGKVVGGRNSTNILDLSESKKDRNINVAIQDNIVPGSSGKLKVRINGRVLVNDDISGGPSNYYYVGRKSKVDEILCMGHSTHFTRTDDHEVIVDSGGVDGNEKDVVENCKKVIISSYTIVKGGKSNYTFYVETANYKGRGLYSEIDVDGTGTIVFPEVDLLSDCDQITYSTSSNTLSLKINFGQNNQFTLNIKNYVEQSSNKPHFVLMDKNGSNIVPKIERSDSSTIKINSFELHSEHSLDNFDDVESYYKKILNNNKDYKVFSVIRDKVQNQDNSVVPHMVFGSSEDDIINFDQGTMFAKGGEGSNVYFISNDISSKGVKIDNNSNDKNLDILFMPEVEKGFSVQECDLHLNYSNASIQVKNYFQDCNYRHLIIMNKKGEAFIPDIQSMSCSSSGKGRLVPFLQATQTQNTFLLPKDFEDDHVVIGSRLEDIEKYKDREDLLLIRKSGNPFIIRIEGFYTDRSKWENISYSLWNNNDLFPSPDLLENVDNVMEYRDKLRGDYERIVKEYIEDFNNSTSIIQHNKKLEKNISTSVGQDEERIGVMVLKNITPDQIEVSSSGEDLIFRDKESNHTINIKGWDNNESYRISKLEFDLGLEPIKILRLNRFSLSEVREIQDLIDKASENYQSRKEYTSRVEDDFRCLISIHSLIKKPAYQCLVFFSLQDQTDFVKSVCSQEQIEEFENKMPSASKFMMLLKKLHNDLSLNGYDQNTIDKCSQVITSGFGVLNLWINKAVDEDKWDEVQTLLDRTANRSNADVEHRNKCSKSWTLLNYFVYNGNVDLGKDIFKLILKKSGSIDALENGNGWAALHYAVHYGDLNMASFLVDEGAKVDVKNKESKTPLYLAIEEAKKNKLDMIKLLFERGVDIEAKDNDGKSPLYLITYSGDLDTIKLLFEMIKAKDNSSLKTIKEIDSLRRKIINQQNIPSNVRSFVDSYVSDAVQTVAKELRDNVSMHGCTAITEFGDEIYNFNKELFKEIIKEFISVVYGKTLNSDEILECINSYHHTEEKIYSYIALLDKMKSKNHLSNNTVFKLAYNVKEIIESGEKYDLREVKNRLPGCVRNVVFPSEVCIRNVEYDEYLHSSNIKVTDNRRVIETVGYSYAKDKVTWKIGFENQGFYIRNINGEYLYAADYGQYDDERRSVFTWIGGNLVKNDEWNIVPKGDICYLVNIGQREYLYSPVDFFKGKYSGKTIFSPLDSRRPVFTWIGGSRVTNSEWKFEDCSRSRRKRNVEEFKSEVSLGSHLFQVAKARKNSNDTQILELSAKLQNNLLLNPHSDESIVHWYSRPDNQEMLNKMVSSVLASVKEIIYPDQLNSRLDLDSCSNNKSNAGSCPALMRSIYNALNTNERKNIAVNAKDVITSGHERLDIENFPIQGKVINDDVNRKKSLKRTLDFRQLVKQVDRDLDIKPIPMIAKDKNDLLIKLSISATGLQKDVVTVRLKDALINNWYKKLQVIFDSAPVEIDNNLKLTPSVLISDNKIIVVTPQNIEEGNKLIICREVEGYTFLHHKYDLIMTNALSANVSAKELYIMYFKDFYKEPKMKTLSIKFIDKEILLSDKINKIYNSDSIDKLNHVSSILDLQDRGTNIKANDFHDDTVLKLAYCIKEVMEKTNNKEEISSLEGLKDKLPESVKNIVFSPTVCVKNVRSDGHLYASSDRFRYNHERRVVSTQVGGRKNQQIFWKSAPSYGNSYIQNVKFNECLYPSVNDMHSNEGRSVFIAFLIIVRTGHRKAESTARRKDSNRGMFFLALFFIANQ